MKNKVLILLSGLAITPLMAHAQKGAPNGVYAQALIDGYAKAQILYTNYNQNIALRGYIQRMTKDNGPVFIEATRLFRFKQQPNCGRVKFKYTQPSSNTTLPFGGQMNVCNDGSPPLRVCKNKPQMFVSPEIICNDKSIPLDTPEVAAAIKAAMLEGELSQKQVLELAKTEKNKKWNTDK